MSQLTTPTFIIGLGGIGNAVLRLIRERFESSSRSGIPDTVKLRSIDTADQAKNETFGHRLPAKMFTRVHDFAANDVVANLRLFPEIQRWWSYAQGTFTPGFVDEGAAARRPVGRIVFFQRFGRIHTALRNDFAAPLAVELQNRMLEAGLDTVRKTPRVYVVASLAGGTGAGLFADVSFLARHMLRESGYDPRGTRLTGIFALPSVVHLASADGQSEQGRQRRINTFGALTEIDFLMRWQVSDFSLNYPDPVGEFRPTPPFLDRVFLFTDRKLGGIRFTNQGDVLLRTAHFIYSQISLDMGQQSDAILHNIQDSFDASERRVMDDQRAIYASFGVEWLEVPRDVILAEYSARLGRRAAELVAEYQYEHESKHNLKAHLISQMSPARFPNLKGYTKAFQILERTATDILSMSGFEDLQRLANDIYSASKPEDLRRALVEFITNTDAFVGKVLREATATATSPQEEEFLLSLMASAIRSPAFRIGGACRLLHQAADLLDQISQVPSDPADSVDDIVKKCTSGFLSKKVSPENASLWANEKVLAATRRKLKEKLGQRAGEFANLSRRHEERLRSLQGAIRRSGEALGTEGVRGSSLPEEMSLLDPSDIRKTLESNLPDIEAEVSNRIAERLADRVEDPDDGVVELAPRDIERWFREEAILAIESAAAARTGRPAAAVKRLKNRMQACEPLAHIADSGVDLLRVMQERDTRKPVKLVLTGMGSQTPAGSAASPAVAESVRVGNDTIADLKRWQNEEQARTGEESFQIVQYADQLRDEVLYLSLGWPLCLFKEVQQCFTDYEAAEQDSPGANEACRVLNEIPGAGAHDIRITDERVAERFFGIALALKHIRLQGGSTLHFAPEVLGREETIPGAANGLSTLFERGFYRFRQEQGSKIYGAYLEREFLRNGRELELKDQLLKGLQERKTALKEQGTDLPRNLVDMLTSFYERAQEHAEQLRVL